MTNHFDRLLRETVRDLATDADVITDRDRHRLAVHAADRAHTLRVRRRGGVAAVVILITALAVGLPYGVRYLSSRIDRGPDEVALPAGVVEIPGVPTHVIDDASKPIELVDGWYVLGNNLVLDRTTNTYIEFGNVYETLPSPNGRWVATSGSRGIAAYRVYDLVDGGSRRYEARNIINPQSSAGWSPDGQTLLLANQPADGFGIHEETGEAGDRWMLLALIDVAGGEITYRNINLTGLACGTCQVTWMPSGVELALILDEPNGTTLGAPTGIQVLSLDGQRMATLPVRGFALGPEAWSPDGQYAFVSGVADNGQWAQQLVAVATGDVVPGWDQLANLARAQWIDNEHFLAWETIGDVSERYSRTMVSLWSIDGTLLERWIPPIDVVRLPAAPGSPLAVHLG